MEDLKLVTVPAQSSREVFLSGTAGWRPETRGTAGRARHFARQLYETVLLDEALRKLKKHNPRQARVVELRRFGDLSVDQIALLLGVAPRSVKRDWPLARVWLFRELYPAAEPPQSDSE